jgi:hypothetical protein
MKNLSFVLATMAAIAVAAPAVAEDKPMGGMEKPMMHHHHHHMHMHHHYHHHMMKKPMMDEKKM